MTTGKTEKIDLQKLHRNEYAAFAKPTLIDVGPASYLAVDGTGAPGDRSFQDGIGALYGMAYTVKFESKFSGRDFTVSKLEGLYGLGERPGRSLKAVRPAKLRWRLMIRVPEFIGEAQLDQARKALSDKGKVGDFDRVRLERLDEGRCVQMLHVGPYDAEQPTIDAMLAFAREQGVTPRGPHHEIYLSDPRRVPPDRLRTILRQPVSGAGRRARAAAR